MMLLTLVVSADTVLQMCPAFDDRDAANVGRAQLRLQALGVQVSWCTEKP